MFYADLQATEQTNSSVIAMQKIFTEEDDDTIRLMCGECCILDIVAKRVGCTLTELKIRAEFLEVSLDYADEIGEEEITTDIKSRRSRPPTQEEDDAILKGCLLGWTWQKIADEMGWHRNSTIERGRRLNARRKAEEILGYNPQRPPPMTEEEEEESAEAKRKEALPAGHPKMWEIISKGLTDMSNPYNTNIYSEFVPQQKKNTPESYFNKLHLCFD